MDIASESDGKLVFERVKDLERYETYGKTLYSPVSGLIVDMENTLPDQAIGTSDIENLAGNYIIIQVRQDVFVLLAHLKSGSVVVSKGESIQVGQRIAEVGNSGNTSQPHLHIQAITSPNSQSKENMGIPIYFKHGRYTHKVYKRGETLSGSAAG
jgi:murein DD-endopeptidase MepM/ murein hydrolase activator NlpD